MQIALIGNTKNDSLIAIQRTLKIEGYPVVTQNPNATGVTFYDGFTKIRDLIIASDLVIADVTVLSSDLIYQLALAIDFRRPTVLAIPEKNKDQNTLGDFKNRNLKVVVYKTMEELKDQLIEHIYEIKDSLDAKLFMNIPPSMNKYLDWVATHTQFNKSDVVRNAVEKAAEEDKKYQEFLNSF